MNYAAKKIKEANLSKCDGSHATLTGQQIHILTVINISLSQENEMLKPCTFQ